MKKITKCLILILITIFSLNYLIAEQEIDLKLKLFKGIKEGTAEKKSKVITSYTITPFFTGRIITKYETADEEKELRKIFNLNNVELLTEANLKWKSSSGEKIFQAISLNGNEYLILLTPSIIKGGCKFRLEIYEGMKQKTQKNLIDVELSLPKDNISVIGFSDSREIPYFLSFRVTGVKIDGIVGGVVGGVIEGVEGEVEEGVIEGVKGEVEEGVGAVKPIREIEKPLKIGEGVKPPRLIKKVIPIYPVNCKKEGIEGLVILEATTDIYGNIVRVKPLKPAHPELDKAAIEAVKQWKYEPYIKDGKPRPVSFTVTVTFKLSKKAKKKREELKEPVRIEAELKPPKLIKKVIPTYPKKCKEEGIEGLVILEVTIDKKGNVVETKVLKSAHSELVKSAIEAVKQWKYKPYVIDGKPRSVKFTVTVTFKLSK